MSKIQQRAPNGRFQPANQVEETSSPLDRQIEAGVAALAEKLKDVDMEGNPINSDGWQSKLKERDERIERLERGIADLTVEHGKSVARAIEAEGSNRSLRDDIVSLQEKSAFQNKTIISLQVHLSEAREQTGKARNEARVEINRQHMTIRELKDSLKKSDAAYGLLSAKLARRKIGERIGGAIWWLFEIPMLGVLYALGFVAFGFVSGGLSLLAWRWVMGA
jgi:uncharacterized coiled-coil protein SlyX